MIKKLIGKKSEEVKEALESPPETDLSFLVRKIEVDSVVSSGSTLLDLAISGKRRRGGGIPGGVLVELYGRSQSGKTAVLAEALASVQSHGGQTDLDDPEARLDKEYSRIYGLSLGEKHGYNRPDTVEQIFENTQSWKPKNLNVINARGTDSLAALTTELELSPKGDKMGMKRAKDFSAGFRKTCRLIANNNLLWVCTNQVRQGDFGETTPGGNAVAFYASIRIRLRKVDDIVKAIKLNPTGKDEEVVDPGKKKEKEKKSGVEVKKVIGIEVEAFVTKTIDDPYRTAPVYIIFGYGIDDIRGNLQYMKDMTNQSKYICPDGKEYGFINMAIQWIEKQNLEGALREQVIDLWETIEKKLTIERKQKSR